MKRLICMILLAAPLLSGCTDIRTRRLPDLLAVETGETVYFAAHSTQDDEIVTAQANAALLMPEALQNTAGAEISTGHLSMLAVSGNPCAVLNDYLQAQYLAPTCEVLSVPRGACALLADGLLPDPSELKAAVQTGMLPYRTADAVIGDLWGGSGITALHTFANGRLTLSLWDAAEQYAASLSPEACRGLALLGSRWETFAFAAEGETFCVKQASFFVRMRQAEGLQITLSGNVTAEPPLTDAARTALTEMLTAALEETAAQYGADLLFLRETALRDGISAADCTQAEWRTMLQGAVCRVNVSA